MILARPTFMNLLRLTQVNMRLIKVSREASFRTLYSRQLRETQCCINHMSRVLKLEKGEEGNQKQPES